jgi:tetratricopeptide (TPR) repeat protein
MNNLWALATVVLWQVSTLSTDGLEKLGHDALNEGRYREAMATFEQVLVQEPRRVSAMFGKAMALVGLLDYGKAVRTFELTVEADPRFGAAWRQLVVFYPQIGQAKEARDAFEQVRKLGDLPDEERLVLTRALRKAGWTHEAREALGSPGRPWSPEEHLELGMIASEEGDDTQAVEHLGLALRTPSAATAEVEYRYGRSLEATKQSGPALAAYRRALELDPTHRSARFRLGNLLLRTGRKEEGQVFLRDYETYRRWDRRVKLLRFMVTSGKLSGEEDRRKTLELVGLLLQGGAPEEAGPLIAAALVRHPGDSRFAFSRAWWLLESGKTELARDALGPLLEPKGAPGDVLWLAARIELAEGRASEAVEIFERILAADPNPPARILQELATAYRKAGRVQEAEATFKRALDKAPNRAEIHAALGDLLESLGRLEEAERLLRRGLELDPNLVAAQLSLGDLLLRNGAAEEAEALLRTSVRFNPGNPKVRRALANALEALRRHEEAEAERKAADDIEARQKHRAKDTIQEKDEETPKADLK